MRGSDAKTERARTGCPGSRVRCGAPCRRSDMGGDGGLWSGFDVDPAFGPGADRADDLAQGAAAVGELVGHADRAVGGDGAGDQALAFELAEALGQEAVGEVGDGGEELVEARGAPDEDAQDGTDPAPADQLDGVLEAGAEYAHGVAVVGGLDGGLAKVHIVSL